MGRRTSCHMLRTRKRPADRRRTRRAQRGLARSRSRARHRPRRARRDPRSVIASLEQRQFDLIGLASVAAGVYLACVLYGGWEGGPVSGWLKGALDTAAGRIAYVVPLALAAWGVVLVMWPFLKAPAATGAGGVLLLAS